MSRTIEVALTEDELNILIESIDSHVYWQLSDQSYRNSGNVLLPGSDDAENRQAIAVAEALGERLQALLR
jgi:hypothetical protein